MVWLPERVGCVAFVFPEREENEHLEPNEQKQKLVRRNRKKQRYVHTRHFFIPRTLLYYFGEVPLIVGLTDPSGCRVPLEEVKAYCRLLERHLEGKAKASVGCLAAWSGWSRSAAKTKSEGVPLP